jgi:hypothetical protein
MSCYPTDQAFPSPGMPFVNAETGVPHDPFAGHGWMRDPRDGLSKRELFAAMAMQGLLANAGGPIQQNGMTGWGLTNVTHEQVAGVACRFADALLTELAK